MWGQICGGVDMTFNRTNVGLKQIYFVRQVIKFF